MDSNTESTHRQMDLNNESEEKDERIALKRRLRSPLKIGNFLSPQNSNSLSEHDDRENTNGGDSLGQKFVSNPVPQTNTTKSDKDVEENNNRSSSGDTPSPPKRNSRANRVNGSEDVFNNEGEKSVVPEQAKRPVPKRRTSTTNYNDSQSPVEETDLSEQKRALDFGLYHGRRGSGNAISPLHIQTGSFDYNPSTFSPRRTSDGPISPKQVDFMLGGDDESDGSSRRSSLQSGPPSRQLSPIAVPVRGQRLSSGSDDGLSSRMARQETMEEEHYPHRRPGRPIHEYKLGDDMDEIDAPGQSDRGNIAIAGPRKTYDSERGFVRHSNGQRDSSEEDQRKISVEEGRVWFTPTSGGGSGLGSGAGGGVGSGGTGQPAGILKKTSTSSQPRGSIGEVVLSPMSEGLRRYRRKSQLMLSSEIPLDVPIKNRRAEHEQRIKGNLEYLKRRVSLQEDRFNDLQQQQQQQQLLQQQQQQQQQKRQPQDMKLAPRRSNSMPPNGIEELRGSLDEKKVMGLPGNGQTLDDDLELVTGQSKDPDLKPNRMSSDSLVVERQLDEEEIDECLGNIPDRLRHPPGLISSPPRVQRNLNATSVDNDAGNIDGMRGTNLETGPQQDDGLRDVRGLEDERGIDNFSFIPDSEIEMLPYVPMKRQRITFDNDSSNWKLVSGIANTEDFDTPPVYTRSGSYTSLSSSMDSASVSSMIDQRRWSGVRKDSLALFYNKPSRLRRLSSQISLENLEQLRRKHSLTPS